jgi:putative IMPACT (imprinted ancient) family translation regulator
MNDSIGSVCSAEECKGTEYTCACQKCTKLITAQEIKESQRIIQSLKPLSIKNSFALFLADYKARENS